LLKSELIFMIKLIFISILFFPFGLRAMEYRNDETMNIVTHTVKRGDTLYDLAYNFDLSLSEILQANPEISDLNLIHVGQKIILPTSHLIPLGSEEGITINLAEPRLYFIGDEIETFPVGIGKDQKTPTGKTKISLKRKNPIWIPPASIREENPELPEFIAAGPDNPLGDYALNLDATKNRKWNRIVIHGTNAPRSIGLNASHGCIRLYPQDIKVLFELVKIGTPVKIINQPIKAKEIEGKIYLEVHKSGIANSKTIICDQITDCDKKIDWQKAEIVLQQNLGIPIEIGLH
jgi:L,D-transpeptidase ErfK/SrfK